MSRRSGSGITGAAVAQRAAAGCPGGAVEVAPHVLLQSGGELDARGDPTERERVTPPPPASARTSGASMRVPLGSEQTLILPLTLLHGQDALSGKQNALSGTHTF